MMRMILSFAVLAGMGQAARAVPIQPEKGKTEFLAIGRPSALKINGTGSGPTGDLKFAKAGEDVTVNGEVDMDLSSFDTGISMRDHHMKEKYLEVEKFKMAKLVFTDAKFAVKTVKDGGTAKIPARLNLHGQEKPVEIEMTLAPQGEKVLSTSKFKLKLTDYAIEVPRFSGITVADEVEVTAQTEVTRADLKGVL